MVYHPLRSRYGGRLLEGLMASSWDSRNETWSQYVSRKTVTDDLVDGIGTELKRVLFKGRMPIGGMMVGIDRMNDGIKDVERAINSIGATFEWGMSSLLAEIGGMKDSLDSLIQTSRTPVQTWAYNQFEIARDAFRQGLYLEALESLETAIVGNATSPGYKLEWRFHHMKGVIQLGFFGCDPDLINVPEAEKSFLLAARYAKVDSPSDSARALLSASWCAYTQKKLPEALEHSKQASVLDPSLSEAFFQMAKVGMALGQVGDALPVLRGVIEKDDGYIIKASSDSDFNMHRDELLAFFEALRIEAQSGIRCRVAPMLDEVAQWPETAVRAADPGEVRVRWHSLLNEDWGLLELLRYDAVVDAEIEEVRTAYNLACERQAKLERERAERERAERERAERERAEREQAAVEMEVISSLDSWLACAVTADQVKRVAAKATDAERKFIAVCSRIAAPDEWIAFRQRINGKLAARTEFTNKARHNGACVGCGGRLSTYEVADGICSSCKRRAAKFDKISESI